MYDEYEESFFYDKPESVNTELATASFALAGGIVGTAISVLVFIISRYDVLSSGLLSLLIYLLTYKNGWPLAVYIIGAISVFLVSMILQHMFRIVRVIYGIFVCVVISILGPMLLGYESNDELYRIMIKCFVVSCIWGCISWKIFVNK